MLANEEFAAATEHHIMEFMDEHPVITITLIMAALGVMALVSNYLDQRNLNAQANQNREEQQSIDVDDLEKRNREAREVLEKEMQASTGERLKECRKMLEFLKNQIHSHLVSETFLYQVREAGSLFEELNAKSKSEQERSVKQITKLYFCIKDLHNEYIQLESAWNDARSEWQTRWGQVHDLLQLGQAFRLPLNTTVGQETVFVDCDFWSRGAMSEAGDSLPSLEQPEDTTIGTFNALSRQAEQLYQRIASIVQQACQDFVQSQMRIQLGNSILESLYSRGWYLEQRSDYGFRNDDQREGLTLKLRSPVSDLVEFTINPDNTMQMRPVFKDVHNRSLIRLLTQVVQSALQKNGINIESVAC